MDERVRETLRRGYRQLLRRVAEHYGESQQFDGETAAGCLDGLAELGGPVSFDADVARLLAKHLRGELAKRRGPTVPVDGPGASMIVRGWMREEFRRRRANGEGFEPAIAELCDASGLARSTVIGIVSPEFKANSGPE